MSSVLGLRNPETRTGELDGAWVYLHREGHGMACLYDSGHDWISRPSLNEAFRVYSRIQDEGWIPMSQKDLEETCGIDFNS